MTPIKELDVYKIHSEYNRALLEISKDFNRNSYIFRMLTCDELSPDGFAPNLREAYYG